MTKSSSGTIHPPSEILDAGTYAQEKYRQCVRTAIVDPVPKKARFGSFSRNKKNERKHPWCKRERLRTQARE